MPASHFTRRPRPRPLPLHHPNTIPSEPSCNSDVPSHQLNDLTKGQSKSRPRRRGRRAGSGNKGQPSLTPSDLLPSPDGPDQRSTQEAPPLHSTPVISPALSPTGTAHDGWSTPSTSFDDFNDRHGAAFPRVERLEHTMLTTFPATHPEVCLTNPPMSAEDVHDTWPTSATSRSIDWPATAPLPSPFSKPASRRPAYIGSHLPIATVNLPETKPFSLATPDFGGAELTLPTAYNSDYPHPLTAYASPGVNSATVAASGYAPRLRDLQESDPRATMGGILSDCGNASMSAPALSLSQGSKDGCGIPEKLWLQLSAWPGVKVPIGAVLPATLAGYGASPRFLQSNTCPVSPTRTGSSGLTSPLTRRHKLPDSPVSPIFSTFTQSRRLASSRSETDLQKMVLDKVMDNFDAPRASRASPSYERRGSLPDLRLSFGSRRGAPLAFQLHDELSRLQMSSSSRQHERHSLAEEEALREISSPRHVMGTRTPELRSNSGRLSLLHSRTLSLGFDSLATVEEADDDLRGAPISTHRNVQPIGAERHYRGQLPTLPLHVHRTRVADDDYAPRTSRASSTLHSTSSSIGCQASVMTPVESHHPLITPPSTTGLFSELRLEPLPAPAVDEFTRTSPNFDCPNLLEHAHRKRAALESPPSYNSTTPSDHADTGLLPGDAWPYPPSSTTLDFSTGNSIWS